MENIIICLDTSILIDYYRKKDKSQSLFYKLTERYTIFAVPAITKYELYLGNSPEQNIFWDDFFSRVIVLPFDSDAVKYSVNIYKQLKRENKLIQMPDIMIAGTAMKNKMSLATLNRKHFERIDNLIIITD